MLLWSEQLLFMYFCTWQEWSQRLQISSVSSLSQQDLSFSLSDEIRREHILCKTQNSYSINSYNFVLLFQTFTETKQEAIPLPCTCWKQNWMRRCSGAMKIVLENHWISMLQKHMALDRWVMSPQNRTNTCNWKGCLALLSFFHIQKNFIRQKT